MWCRKNCLQNVHILVIYTPSRYTNVYEPFSYLLTKDADRFVDKFITKQHSLLEYVKEIEKLKDMASTVASLPIAVPMHLFLLDCHKINQVLRMRCS